MRTLTLLWALLVGSQLFMYGHFLVSALLTNNAVDLGLAAFFVCGGVGYWICWPRPRAAQNAQAAGQPTEGGSK